MSDEAPQQPLPTPAPTISTQAVEDALKHGNPQAAIIAACELLELPPDSTPESKVGNTKALAPISRAIAGLMQNLTATPAIQQFLSIAATRMSAAAMEFLTKHFAAELELTTAWAKRLADMAHERQSNELTDAVKSNDLKNAQQIIQIMLLGTSEKSRTAKGKFIANLLGGLVIEKDRASALLRSVSKSPAAFGLDPVAVIDMEEEFVRAGNAVARRERPTATTSRAELTQAAVELSRSLPGRMVLADPTDEQIEQFLQVLRALWRCALSTPAGDGFHDVSALLVELSPKEVSAAGALAGVEQRLHAQLGRTARTIAARGLETIGRLEPAFRPYLAWAKSVIDNKTKGARHAIEVLGLLHQPTALPLLQPLLRDRQFLYRSETIFAIGAIGDPSSFDILAKQLDEDLRGRVIEGAKRREAFSIISALGRSTRTLDPTLKSRVLQQIIKLLPNDDTELAVRVALNFFLGNLEGMDSTLLQWGARTATTALWSADRPELARAGKNAMLGFRQPLVDLCARLLPHAGHEVRNTATAMCKQYVAGAYLSLGELWYKVADPEALPVLQQLIFNTVLHDENAVASARSAYVKSTVRDAETEQQIEIGKDRVLAALIHAVDKCGTPEAEAQLADMFEQAQTGRLQGVGQESVEILMKAHQKAGNTIGLRTKAANDEPNDDKPKSLTPEDIERLGDLKATYWLASSKRAKKVGAFAHLGQAKIAAAIEPAVAHLNDADPIIASAALTCLTDMVSGPATPQNLKQQHAQALQQALASRDNPLRVKAAEVLKKVGPKREPWATMLAELAQTTPANNFALRAVLESILGGTGLAATRDNSAEAQNSPQSPNSPPGQSPDSPAAQSLANSATLNKSQASASTSALERKRQYMLARQAWIKGGKKGPEPQPPE